MVRGSVARRLAGVLGSWLTLAVAAPAAQAVEFLEGAIQVHGYFEETIRAISTDFNQSLDLTQWYHTLHLEMDIDIAKSGWGPFDSVGAYIGAEVRYDCVWTRACGFSPSVNVYGNRSSSLPSRLDDAKDPLMSGTTSYMSPTINNPDRKIKTIKTYSGNIGVSYDASDITKLVTPASALTPAGPRLLPRSDIYRGVNQTSPFGALLGTRTVLSYGAPIAAAPPYVDYIPGRYTFERFLGYGFALRNVRGGNNGVGTQAMPWDPKDDIDPFATLRDRVNPFRTADVNPETGIVSNSYVRGGSKHILGNLPFRPAPNFGPDQAPDSGTASGLYLPSAPYARYALDGGSDKFDQNFSQDELAWNRGASQQQTKELKEAYLELEMLGGALFVRLGRQTIVWGKTEIFATTDLFNPNDLALGSLTSLEESRIPLWAMRAIYSFYEVGPLEDVRLELALDLDDFTPNDLGRCGEAYTPNPVCDKTMGLLAHGLLGLGAAGENRPPHWWDSWKGLQGGARLEFRWDRYSFALVDFWNYTKFPYADRLSTYERNVDPATGRPRRYGATGPCSTALGAANSDPACLQGGNDALANAAVNQQIFAVICSSSVGFSALDRTVCAQSVLGSADFQAAAVVSVAQLVSEIISGSPNGIQTAIALTSPLSRMPMVSLGINSTDGSPTGFFGTPGTGLNPFFDFGVTATSKHNSFQTLAQVLTSEQQALLGCGPFYGTPCDGGANQVNGDPAPGGMDMLNMEASAVMQSWTGIEGSPLAGYPTTDSTRPQPGTMDFQGGPVCTRVLPNGQQVMLPGCRGPADPGYDPAVDGPDPRTTNIGFPAGVFGIPLIGAAVLGPIRNTQGHPFAANSNGLANVGQYWRSEMAALSWNIQMLLVAFSVKVTDPIDPLDPVSSNMSLRFDPTRAYRTDGCSYVMPFLCSGTRAFWGVTGVRRQSVNAGGNGRFGRRDMVWAQGGEAVISYQKRNVLGFSMDFAEDVTKTNWGTEFTWVRNNPFSDQNKFGGVNKTEALNFTVSVDRPTFINFMNQSRTFFFNSQLFFSYVPGYHNSFTSNGPWNVFATFTAQTGYFQDRLLPGITFVYDVQSESGAALPSVTYSFTESFSATFGFALFWGRYEGKHLPLNPLAPSNQAGAWAYRSWVENGLAVIRDRDEVYMRLRYTF